MGQTKYIKWVALPTVNVSRIPTEASFWRVAELGFIKKDFSAVFAEKKADGKSRDALFCVAENIAACSIKPGKVGAWVGRIIKIHALIPVLERYLYFKTLRKPPFPPRNPIVATMVSRPQYSGIRFREGRAVSVFVLQYPREPPPPPRNPIVATMVSRPQYSRIRFREGRAGSVFVLQYPREPPPPLGIR